MSSFIGNSGEGVPNTTQVNAGDGLTGGGELTGDITINVGAAPDGSIIVEPHDIEIGVLASDAQHGIRSGGNLHSIASESAHGFMSLTDKYVVNHYMPTAGEKDALAGTSGTPSASNKFLTANDTSIAPRYHTVTVSPVASPPYNSVANTVASITGASALDQYAVYIAPGTYNEFPIVMKPYISIIGKGGHARSVTLQTLDNYANFINGAYASSLIDVDISGPRGAGYSAIYYDNDGDIPFIISSCNLLDGYYGITSASPTLGVIEANDISVINTTLINTFMNVTNKSIIFARDCIVTGLTSTCVTGWKASGAVQLLLSNCTYNGYLGGVDAVFADNGAYVNLTGCDFDHGVNAVHVGSTGTDTEVYVNGCVLHDDSFTYNVLADTNTCIVAISGGILWRDRLSIPAGTRFTASFVDDNHASNPGAVVRGELWCGPIAATIPLVSYTKATGNTGVAEGGEVTRTGGFNVSVSEGYGFIDDGQILKKITWPTTSLTLTPNKSAIYIICDENGLFQESFFVTTPYNSISFAIAATDSDSITVLGSSHVVLEQAIPASFIYTRDVVGPISVSGTAVTKHGSPSLQLDVDGGNYYIYNVPKTADAYTQITFTYWHRNATGWIASDGYTSIDKDGYDAYNYTGSSTIQSIPSGKFKRDLLYLTTNGAGTEYHVVYSQQVFDSALVAISNPNPPDLFNNIGLRLAGIVIQKGSNDISTIYDQRPKLGQLAAAGTAITDHGSLSGLLDNDHPQYQLRTEKNAASGYCGLNGSSQVATAQLPFTSTPPTNVTKSAAVTGSSNQIAYSDHKHDVSTAAPSTIGTSNVEGSSSSLARADHIHNHGQQTDGYLHQLATTGLPGFMNGTDKRKLDGLPTSAVSTATQVIAGAGLTGGGTLSSDVTLNVAANADNSITVNANDIQVGVLATDGQHGNRGGGAIHSAVTSSVNGFMLAADKVKLDGYLPSAGQKDALAGSYGTPSNTNRYITENDPSFTRYHVVTVAPAGGNFTSVAAAINSITGATALDQYAVFVWPGTYIEPPFSMKPYVYLVGKGGKQYSVTLVTNNNSAHFITGAYGSGIEEMGIVGPTNSGYAAVYYNNSNALAFRMDNVVIADGYYGIYCNPVSAGFVTLYNVTCANLHTMNSFVYVANGAITAYNPVVYNTGVPICYNGFRVSGATSTAEIYNFVCSSVGGSNSVFLDNGAFVRMYSGLLGYAYSNVHIGSTGTGTEININGCVFLEDTATWQILADTPNCTITITGGALRRSQISVPLGILFNALFVDDSEAKPGTTVQGEIWCGGPNGTIANIPLVDYTKATGDTGVAIGGGELSRVSGLTIKVAEGYGYLYDGTTLTRVSWPDTNFTLNPNKNGARIVVDKNGVFKEQDFTTDPSTAIAFGVAITDATSVQFLTSKEILLAYPNAGFFNYTRDVVGPISVSGAAVTKHGSPSLKLDVDAGTYYIQAAPKTASASASITFTYWRRNNIGNWVAFDGYTSVDADGYDAYNYGISGRSLVPSGKYKRDLLFLSSNGSGTEYHMVYGQQVYNDALSATNNPNPPDIFSGYALRLAGIIVQRSATDINTIADQRPKLGQLAAAGTAITIHGQLAGLSADDHKQYQLRSEENQISGYCGLNASAQVATAQLPFTATPPANVTKAAAAVGISTEIARADHKHDISTAAPSTIATSNTEGSSTSLARADHIHAHGNQTDGYLHQLVTSGLPGFMSGADKKKLDNMFTLASTVPADVTKATAAVGIGTTAARADHKHDISTATPATGAVAIGNAAAEGTATSLARSDHTHTVASGVAVSVGTANNAGTAATFSRSDHVHSGLTRGAADFTTFTHKTTPIGADTILLEDSANSQAKVYATATEFVTALDPFGRDFQSAASEGASTTTSGAFGTKVTLTTPALTGTYRVGCYAELSVTVGGGASRDVQARFFNSTDATVLATTRVRLITLTTDVHPFSAHQYITFTGAAKTFTIDFASPLGSTVSIARARIEIWRVS